MVVIQHLWQVIIVVFSMLRFSFDTFLLWIMSFSFLLHIKLFSFCVCFQCIIGNFLWWLFTLWYLWSKITKVVCASQTIECKFYNGIAVSGSLLFAVNILIIGVSYWKIKSIVIGMIRNERAVFAFYGHSVVYGNHIPYDGLFVLKTYS